MKPDLDSREQIESLVRNFYRLLLVDNQLSGFFTDITAIDFSKHFPLICNYWEKLLLGKPGYNRHTMNVHRNVNIKKAFAQEDFQRWLGLFETVVDGHFEGKYANRAKALAIRIAGNMQRSLAA